MPESKPILFKPRLVRAILDGRKTQTRRVIKPQPDFQTKGVQWKSLWIANRGFDIYKAFADIACPYGEKGDQLWVREAWNHLQEIDGNLTYLWNDDGTPKMKTFYKATDPDHEDSYYDPDTDETSYMKWKPSIHMPRWASRLTLEIINTRVERIQDISDNDAFAEGCNGPMPCMSGGEITECGPDTPVHDFKDSWDSINKKRGYGWQDNPWVWVIEFKKLKGA